MLTRTTRESREIGEVLRAAQIPFAFFKQERLFETVEAREVLDLLRAIVDPDDRTARARAFITPFFGLSLTDLAACEDLGAADALLRLLYEWRALAAAGDFEALFARIVDDSGVVCRELCLRQSERALTNHLHILEILQEEAARTRATIRELAQTLGAYILGTRRPPGDGRDIQRLETDAEAVQIMTIHHAKGLEAPVVFVYGGFWPGPSTPCGCSTNPEGRRLVRVGRQPADERRRHEAEQEDEERPGAVRGPDPREGPPVPAPLPGGLQTPAARLYRIVNERLHADWRRVHRARGRGAVSSVVPVPCPGEAPPAPPLPRSRGGAGRLDPPASLLAPSARRATSLRDLARARAGFLMTSYSAVKRLHGGFVPAPVWGPTPPPRAGPLPRSPSMPAELARGRASGASSTR